MLQFYYTTTGQIITLKNGETKILVGYSDGEYLVVDYEIEKSLTGYEKPKQEIPIFNVQKSELRKFNEVVFLAHIPSLSLT